MHLSSTCRTLLLLLVAAAVFVNVVNSLTIPNSEEERRRYPRVLADDEDAVDNYQMNYPLLKAFLKRLRDQDVVTDMERKRSYWKQCAFNAVSCFGK